MNRFKDVAMMSLCALMLSIIFLAFAFLALFSETARWIVDRSMHATGDIISEGEQRSIDRHRSAEGT